MQTIESEENFDRKQESNPEQRETLSKESGIENEQNSMDGAQMLETPSDGSFVHGLQLFIAWVKALVANDK